MQEFLYEVEPIIPMYAPLITWVLSNDVQGINFELLSYGYQDWSEVKGITKTIENNKTPIYSLGLVIITLSLVVFKRKKNLRKD